MQQWCNDQWASLFFSYLYYYRVRFMYMPELCITQNAFITCESIMILKWASSRLCSKLMLNNLNYAHGKVKFNRFQGRILVDFYLLSHRCTYIMPLFCWIKHFMSLHFMISITIFIKIIPKLPQMSMYLWQMHVLCTKRLPIMLNAIVILLCCIYSTFECSICGTRMKIRLTASERNSSIL